jgi:hypothetical protein
LFVPDDSGIEFTGDSEEDDEEDGIISSIFDDEEELSGLSLFRGSSLEEEIWFSGFFFSDLSLGISGSVGGSGIFSLF